MTTPPGAPAAAALRSLEADRQTAVVVHAFGNAGVPVLMLKGPAIARWLYPPGATRPVCDVDLLVPPSHWEAGIAVLEGLGLRCAGLGPEHAAFWTAEDRLSVDLHRTANFAGAAPEQCWAVLSGQAETIALAGELVRVPSRPAQAALLALHAVSDGRGSRALSELELAIDREQLDLWAQARGIAIELRAVDAFAAALRAARGGGELANRLELPQASRIDVELALEAAPSAHGLARLGDATGVLDLSRRLLGELAPPAEEMRARSYPLAGRGRLGLAVSYVLRPLIVARRLPAAVGARRRARVRLGLASGDARRSSVAWRVRVALEVLAASVRVRRRLKREGIGPAIALARAGAPLAVEHVSAVADARRLGGATRRVLDKLPGETSCLIESLVLLRLLARRGVRARLILALKPRGVAEAHAWVEVAGEPVLPPSGDGFARLAEL